MYARFDARAANAVIARELPAASEFALEADVLVQASTIAALQPDWNWFPTLLGIGRTADPITSQKDGINAGSWSSSSDPFDWSGFWNAADTGVAVTAGLRTIRYEATWSSGTTWDVALKVDGATIASYTEDIGITNTDPLRMTVGAINAANTAADVYFFSAARAYDAATGGSLIFSRDFSAGLGSWDSTVGRVAAIEEISTRPVYTLELCDRATDTLLADLTSAAVFTVKPRRSGVPTEIDVTVAGDNPDIRATWASGDGGDDLRKLLKGIRTLKVRQDSALVAHGIVWDVDYQADETSTVCTITAFDPLKTFPGRVYRDSTGNLIDPDIASPISGAEIIKGGVDNSVSNSGSPGDMEGALPLDTAAGTFDTTIPPAADLGLELTDWPIDLDDLLTLIRDTGAVDVWVDPVDTAMGYDPGIIGRLNVANRRGSDLSGSISFDWDTGNRQAAKARRHDSMDRVVNKWIYYLGPKKTKTRWAGNITATETTPEDLSAYLALEEASRDKYWTIMRIRIFDDNADDNADRKLYHEVWKQDVVSSVEGQEVIHITPTADADAQPFRDYSPGDSVGFNISDRCGPAVSGGLQRVDAFDVTVGVDGLGLVSEFQTIQDA